MKPMLFNTEMVRAILDGRKTVTRRLVKPQPKLFGESFAFKGGVYSKLKAAAKREAPYHPGDVIYVRETFYQYGEWYDIEERNEYEELVSKHTFVPKEGPPIYFADTLPDAVKVKRGFKSGLGYYKRPSLFMPISAARIFLRVTDVRVERLQDVTEEQAIAEGIFLYSPDFIPTYHYQPQKISGQGWDTARECFRWGLWNSTIKLTNMPLYGWDANPWVWVIEFERISKEDALNA